MDGRTIGGGKPQVREVTGRPLGRGRGFSATGTWTPLGAAGAACSYVLARSLASLLRESSLLPLPKQKPSISRLESRRCSWTSLPAALLGQLLGPRFLLG